MCVFGQMGVKGSRSAAVCFSVIVRMCLCGVSLISFTHLLTCLKSSVTMNNFSIKVVLTC